MRQFETNFFYPLFEAVNQIDWIRLGAKTKTNERKTEKIERNSPCSLINSSGSNVWRLSNVQYRFMSIVRVSRLRDFFHFLKVFFLLFVRCLFRPVIDCRCFKSSIHHNGPMNTSCLSTLNVIFSSHSRVDSHFQFEHFVSNRAIRILSWMKWRNFQQTRTTITNNIIEMGKNSSWMLWMTFVLWCREWDAIIVCFFLWIFMSFHIFFLSLGSSSFQVLIFFFAHIALFQLKYELSWYLAFIGIYSI